MKNQYFESLKKMKPDELLMRKKELRADLTKEIAGNSSTGLKSSNKSREMKKKIAWVETAYSQSFYQKAINEENNG